MVLIRIQVARRTPHTIVRLGVTTTNLVRYRSRAVRNLNIIINGLIMVLLNITMRLIRKDSILQTRRLHVRLYQDQGNLTYGNNIIFRLLSRLRVLGRQINQIRNSLTNRTYKFNTNLLVIRRVTLIRQRLFRTNRTPRTIRVPPTATRFAINSSIRANNLLLNSRFNGNVVFRNLRYNLIGLTYYRVNTDLLRFYQARM